MKTSDMRILGAGEEYPYANRPDLFKVRARVGNVKLGCADFGGEAEAVENAQAIANDLGCAVELQFLRSSVVGWQTFQPEGTT